MLNLLCGTRTNSELEKKNWRMCARPLSLMSLPEIPHIALSLSSANICAYYVYMIANACARALFLHCTATMWKSDELLAAIVAASCHRIVELSWQNTWMNSQITWWCDKMSPTTTHSRPCFDTNCSTARLCIITNEFCDKVRFRLCVAKIDKPIELFTHASMVASCIDDGAFSLCNL